MCAPFTINFDGDPQAVFNRIKGDIIAANGTIDGNLNQGTFSVNNVSGTYAIKEHHIDITIIHKPFIIPCRTIEHALRERFEGI